MAEKPEDLSLPASVVARIIKDAVPEGVNVSKEARTAIGKAASVFILYATACANNFALKGKRKTLNASDVFSALEDMEFDQMVPELKECLEAYKQEQKGKREAAADRRKLKQAAAAQATTHAPPEPLGGSSTTSLPPSLLPTATIIQAQALSSLAAVLSASPHLLTSSAPIVSPAGDRAPAGASTEGESAVDGESMEVDPVVDNASQSAPSQPPPPLASADVNASVPTN